MIFEPNYRKIIKRMEEQGRVVTLSKESTYKLDHELAMKLLPIKKEASKKERASRNYIGQLESKTACV